MSVSPMDYESYTPTPADRPWRVVATHTFYVYAASKGEALDRAWAHVDAQPVGAFGELDTHVTVEEG